MFQVITALANWPAWLCKGLVLGFGALGVVQILRCPREESPRRLFLVIPFLTVLLQIGIEGFRGQLIAAYLVAMGLLAFVVSKKKIDSRYLLRSGVAASLLLLVSLFAVLFVPDFKMAPTGPYDVGTLTRHLVDASRRESLAKVSGPRELMIQIWYPAEPSRRPRWSISSFLKSRGDLTWASAPPALKIPISQAQASYPVIVYSPSWHGQRDQNKFQTEELASHGYIVVGIDHPYGSRLTVFPDGRIARAQMVDFRDRSSAEALRRSEIYIAKQLSVRVQDVEFLVDQLKEMNKSTSGDFLSGRMNLNLLGIVGYSFGGAVAAEVCWKDKRFRAGIDLDGSLFGEVAETGISRPFLFLTETIHPPTASQLESANPMKRQEAEDELHDYAVENNSAKTYGAYFIGIDGTDHVNFTSPPESPPLRYYLKDAGAIDPSRAMFIINTYTLSFFDRVLRQEPERLLEGPSSRFPEVHFALQGDNCREKKRVRSLPILGSLVGRAVTLCRSKFVSTDT